MAIVDIRIVSEGNVLAHDGRSIGEVQVRGACVTDKYFELDLPGRWTEDGWLCTGDIGHIDPGGNLKVLERKEDLIKSGGEWIPLKTWKMPFLNCLKSLNAQSSAFHMKNGVNGLWR